MCINRNLFWTIIIYDVNLVTFNHIFCVTKVMQFVTVTDNTVTLMPRITMQNTPNYRDHQMSSSATEIDFTYS